MYPWEDREYLLTPQQKLWRAVIVRAIQDMVGNSQKDEDKTAKWQAEQWITGNGKEFRCVCELADLNPMWVCEQLKKLISSNDLEMRIRFR